MPSGNVSLYLDIYQGGNRTYEYLHLYLVPSRTREDKEKNRQTMMLAEAIRAKRIVEVMNGEYGFKRRTAMPLFAYFERIKDTRHGSTRRRYNAVLSLVKGYERRTSMMVADITPAWYNGLLRYMGGQGLAPNTMAVYVATVRCIINQAHRESYLQNNSILQIKGTGYEDTNRIYLTVDEVQRLVATPCDNDVTKRAFLFGCLTGLRHCDIRALTWGDVTEQDGYTRIIYRQSKTRGQEYLDINPQAAALMGVRGRDDVPVFPLMSWSSMSRHITDWRTRAGITKRVTFHSSRHTFAVMMLGIGTDIYTVSKLLGHRELSTTQVYAHVIDKAKREAVDSIPEILKTEKNAINRV